MHEQINVPIYGIVENMSWFTPTNHPEDRYYIFGKGGAKELSQKYNLPILAEIPLVQGVCERGDAGIPAVNDQNSAGKAFRDLAGKVISLLA